MYKFEVSCVNAVCVSRPSKQIKSPYVADIKIEGSEEICLAHSPALGLGNIITQGTKLYVTPSTNTKSKTDYNIKAAYDSKHECWVGAVPLDANRLFKWAYENELILNDYKGTLKSEVKYGESRIDFSISLDNDELHYFEVKCVPLKHENGHSFFPEGYRKSKTHTVSERANKHVYEMSTLGAKGHIVFIVLRDDTTEFKVNENDKQFCEVIHNARENGVHVHVYSVGVSKEGYSWGKNISYIK